MFNAKNTAKVDVSRQPKFAQQIQQIVIRLGGQWYGGKRGIRKFEEVQNLQFYVEFRAGKFILSYTDRRSAPDYFNKKQGVLIKNLRELQKWIQSNIKQK